MTREPTMAQHAVAIITAVQADARDLAVDYALALGAGTRIRVLCVMADMACSMAEVLAEKQHETADDIIRRLGAAAARRAEEQA